MMSLRAPRRAAQVAVLLPLAVFAPLAQTPAAPEPPLCAAELHARHAAQGPGGEPLATWHPSWSARHRCAYGHEHGSNPRAFRGFGHSGMPAFGAAAAVADERSELAAHSGFKVFVVNDDGRGKAWMAVLHQGTGSARRATVRFHSLEVWLVRRRDSALLAHVNLMADFGGAVPNCPGAAVRAAMRLIPQVGCESPYEEWLARVNVGGAFRANPTFGVDNPTTRLNPDDPAALWPNARSTCGPAGAFGWQSGCKGDRRSVLHPRWHLVPRGQQRFRTDPWGRAATRRSVGTIVQYVRRNARVDDRTVCCREASTFTTRGVHDHGGVFRPGDRPSASLETRPASVRWRN